MQSPPEDHVVHRDGVDQPHVKPVSGKQSQKGTECRQQQVFAIDIGGRLHVIEAQDLQRRELADPLCHVDIGEVEKDQEGQHGSCQNNDPHDNVQTLQALVEVVPRLCDPIVCDDALERRHSLRDLFGIKLTSFRHI